MRTCSVRSFAASSSARNTASSCCNSSDLFACALAESNAAAVIAPLSSSFRSNVAFDSATSAFDSATSASSASTRSCSSSALAACAADASALASSLVRASSSLALSWSRSEATSSSVFRRRFLCVATARSSASRSLTPSAIRLCAAASSSLRPFSLSLNFLTRPAETFSFFLNFSSSLESPPSSVPWSGDFSAAAAIALACSSSPSRSVIRRWDAPSASFMASLISSSRSTAALHCACRVSFAICSMSSSSCFCCSLRCRSMVAPSPPGS
mmetsp:Transcript_1636/g.6189  ORF Transcript_1636/g.6189 Transcript_1636/m.6189 type:complete len:270 (-) Transcript_1636:24-833(-)